MEIAINGQLQAKPLFFKVSLSPILLCSGLSGVFYQAVAILYDKTTILPYK
jgi:hypothetical protein